VTIRTLYDRPSCWTVQTVPLLDIEKEKKCQLIPLDREEKITDTNKENWF
jgi:hypothetical protein